MGNLRLDRWWQPQSEQEWDSQIWKIARPGVKRNFWPVIVSQLFCFSEQRN